MASQWPGHAGSEHVIGFDGNSARLNPHKKKKMLRLSKTQMKRCERDLKVINLVVSVLIQIGTTQII